MFKLPRFFFLLSKPEKKWQALLGGYGNKQCFRQNFQQIRKMRVSMMNGLERFMSKELKGYKILQHRCISLHFTEKGF